MIEDLQRFGCEAFTLFEAAKNRGRPQASSALFNQLVQLFDRFAELHRLVGPKGSTVINVDRSTKVVAILNDMAKSDPESLRRYLAGDVSALPDEVTNAMLEGASS